MTIGMVGKKCGMTRIFTEDGKSLPVTVLNIEPHRVVAIMNIDKHGYDSVQMTTGAIKASKITKPVAGHFAKAGVVAGSGLWEFRLDEKELNNLSVGAELKVEMFKEGMLVDVTSKSKGKGFAGVVKRHNFHMQDATHGNSLSHRAPGSIGQNQDPGRVFKGKKMAGQLGNVRCTVQNQEIVRVDAKRNLLLIKGTVPGAKGAYVVVKPAVKVRGEQNGA